ncbi:MAG TPA: hypothetical protein HPP81_10225 [Deltaproteobacteria bacterium]|nr:hypothetical protein [Deltaproteobacteria bacterium]HIJ77076.1 hypothetical protein [Deltaproteobacteria bacterium]
MGIWRHFLGYASCRTLLGYTKGAQAMPSLLLCRKPVV